MSDAFITDAQAEANSYWAERDVKKWVVTLEIGPQRKPIREVKYVSARTAAGAIACGKANATQIKRATRSTARLATAYDLGCVRVSAGETS